MTHKPAPGGTVTPLRRPLGVVVIEPLGVVRAGLELLIAEQPDMVVLAAAGDGEKGVDALLRSRRSRVAVLVGLGLEGPHDAGWVMRTIRERFPSHVVMAVGANADPTTVSRALFVGADGYIDKQVSPERFIDAIRSAVAGEMVLAGPEPGEAGDIASAFEIRRLAQARLTERELEVLTVAAEGLTARQIADRLGVRERTITTHLGRIYGKLGVGSRLAAVRSATRSGLVGAALAE